MRADWLKDVWTISEQFFAKHRRSTGSHPSYRHEEPASPTTCITLLTGGLLGSSPSIRNLLFALSLALEFLEHRPRALSGGSAAVNSSTHGARGGMGCDVSSRERSSLVY